MKMRWIAVAVVVASAVGFVASRGFGDEDEDEEEKGGAGGMTPEQVKEMEAAYGKLALVGEEHRRLAAMAGDWEAEGTSLMGPEAETFKGTAKITAVLGGRFIREESHGESPKTSWESLGYRGFDNSVRKYVGTWMDTMGTGIARMIGTYDEATNTYTDQLTWNGPGGVEQRSRLTLQVVSDKEMLLTMYMVQGTAEKKVMELRYKRK